ncbi:MAG: DUF3300 domain-containing protein [Syntrophorhabdaceae bacterium]
MNKFYVRTLVWILALSLIIPAGLSAQSKQLYKPEELSQLVAPIALYPDDLIAQILMASTYPLEVVEAARWVKSNPNLKGSQLTSLLEKQNWDPSIKSLVNFPSVLNMMNEKLDWTQKLGDAFLSQQKDVMSSIQGLRAKAEVQGTLKSTSEQKVVVQDQMIVIQPANPQVIYVPTYNPTVVYGAWPYPSYPPYYYYPPGYTAGVAAFSFAAGVAVGAAWGYAWGGCNWNHGDVNVNVNKNTTINNQINRSAYASKVTTNVNGTGEWKHDPDHRKGVAYNNQSLANKYGQAQRQGLDSRKDYRGRTPDSRTPDARGGDRPGKGGSGQQIKPSTTASRPDAANGSKTGNAFEGMDRSGAETKMASDRGKASGATTPGMRSGGAERSGTGFSRTGGGGGGRRR